MMSRIPEPAQETEIRRSYGKKLFLVFVMAILALAALGVKWLMESSSIPPTISKDTTVIEGPFRPNGMPDYIAALNERIGKGITPENNAAVPFWQAMGPKPIDPKCRDRFFQLLGISTLPEKGDYYIDLEIYLISVVGMKLVKAQPLMQVPALFKVLNR
jgi:hypothetical protein